MLAHQALTVVATALPTWLRTGRPPLPVLSWSHDCEPARGLRLDRRAKHRRRRPMRRARNTPSFIPRRGDDVVPLRAVCQQRLVHGECLRYALDDETLLGLCGGSTHKERGS